MITLEDYLKKHEELTLKEQENKINHGRKLDAIEQCHRNHVQIELDLYNEKRRLAREEYIVQVQALQMQKRELKAERLLSYQEECRAVGAES